MPVLSLRVMKALVALLLLPMTLLANVEANPREEASLARLDALFDDTFAW